MQVIRATQERLPKDLILLILYSNIYDLFLFRHCGIRTAGELLFLLQPKKSNQKKAAPIRLPRKKHSGCLNAWVLPTSPPWCAVQAHKAKFAFPGEFALPTLKHSANEKGLQKPTNRNKGLSCSVCITLALFYFFDLPPPLSKPLKRRGCHGLSAPACLSVFCEFWRSMITATFQWEPLCLLQGRSCSGGFFWLLFLAVEKE